MHNQKSQTQALALSVPDKQSDAGEAITERATDGKERGGGMPPWEL
jgi:hypothetical protein